MYKISVITASYNCLESLKKTIQSVKKQNYNNIEHIIVDGKSNDGTFDFLNEEIRSPNIFIYEKDFGIYDALNKGVLKSSGDIICFLHSDDIFYDDSVLSYVNSCFQKKKIDGLYGNLEYITKDGSIVRNWKSSLHNKRKINNGWMPPHPTLILKKYLYDQVGLFNCSYKISSDYDFILRVFNVNKYKIDYIDRKICKMVVGGASNKNFSSIIKKMKEDYKIIRSHNLNGFITLFLKNISKIKQFF
jgi:glycosyltransferase